MCYLSTDYVFDGTKPEPYVEWDAPSPVSVYGRRSKLGGEWEVDGGSATIVRTSWVCGLHGSNMVKTILRLAGEHEKLAFVDDQRASPASPTTWRRRSAGWPSNAGPASSTSRTRARCRGSSSPGPCWSCRPRSGAGTAHRHRRPRPAPARAAPTQLRAGQRRPAPRWAPASPPLPGAVGAPRGAPAIVTERGRPLHRPQLQRRRSHRGVCAAPRATGGRTGASRSCSSTTSSDGVVDRARAEWPDLRVIESDRNLGFAGGCNLALRDLDEVDAVALVNSDVLVEPGWLAPLARWVTTRRSAPRARRSCSRRAFARSSCGPAPVARVEATGGGSACG